MKDIIGELREKALNKEKEVYQRVETEYQGVISKKDE